ncbi:interferon-induced, double-stranded RNA-activated protein kinase-like isoform X2 [Pseudoliparis swirei]|uniref:interferon-induced, double-stranded RNA-activated protein kinase-like isoform X2 n=1 Tax=Pseudoliparis swirei TaxID=2059687 RepID=UPI0024BE6DAF|nr:interferon-induced, double-stranded RNA-activated protein kinase-like isoform X2 [Pseudoliparis swirei]
MAIADLNLYAQKERLELKYEDVGCVGPDHIRTFTVRAVLGGKPYPEGVGKNKKEAKLKAAENALSVLTEEITNHAEPTTGASAAPADQTSITQPKYMSWLNEYSQQKRCEIRPVESMKLEQTGATQCCMFVVGGKEYPVATGRTKKDAKEEAAKLVHHEICGSNTTELLPGDLPLLHSPPSHPLPLPKESFNSTSAQREEESNQNVSDICEATRRLNFQDNNCAETNFIGLVNHDCQKTNRTPRYVEDRRIGPPDKHLFFYKLRIDKKDYPVGEGKTIKKAKQNAAQLAWSALQEQTDWDSKVSVRSTEDGGPPIVPAMESNEPASSSSAVGTGGSIISTDSTNSSQDQSTGNSQNETSIQSSVNLCRFTSDFDTIVYLGRGAYGCVYKARHKLEEKYFAVKVVRYEETSLREVGTLSDLLHHNIVRYYNSWMEDSEYQGDSESTDSSAGYSSLPPPSNSSANYLYIQLELCDTKTLKEWIEEKNTESLQVSKRREEGRSIAQQILSGVEYIHSQKHIHRDLKPENILFGLDGEVKIGDFGLVTRDDDDDDDALMERTGQRGTTTYMAPEQKREKKYDRKVDIFALGLIYFELLWKLSTGHERGTIWDDARSQKLPEEFPLNFPQENQIIESMLHEKPEDRPEASNLKAEMELCAQTLNAQNTHQEDETV